MPLDAGDIEYDDGLTVTLDSGANTVNKGDAVNFDASGDLQQTTANGDDVVGVAHEVESDGMVTVVLAGPVVHVTADGSVSAGDTLVPSGTTNGEFVSHGGGMYEENPDTGAGAIAANHPFALEDASDGDTFAACFR